MIKKANDLEKIDNKIEKLTQLHNLHSIENVIVTISFATLILGINIYLNTSVNAIWKIAALFLIMFTIYPLILFFSTFLSYDNDAKVRALETIISIACLHLIGLGFLTLIGWLLSYNYFLAIIEFFGITDLTPILVFLIFEFWGIFLHYWIYHFEPHLEKERFSLLVNLNRPEKKFKIIGRKVFRVIFLPFTIILFVSFFIWCILITEYFQAILILIIGLLNTFFLFKLIKVDLKAIYMKKKNNNNSKKPNNKSKPKEFDYIQLFIIIALISGMFGVLFLTANYEPEKLIYPNNSGDHLIYYDNENIGLLKINANIISDIDVIAAGTPTKIIANISYFPHNDLYNETLHFWLWYMGVDNTWIIPVKEIFINPGEYVLIEKEINFLSEGVYRHALRSYNGNKISPEYMYGSNFSVYGKDTAIAIEHSYIQRESNDRIIGLSCIVVAASFVNIWILLKKNKNKQK